MSLAATKMLEVCLLMVFPLAGTSVPKIISFAGIISQDQTSVPTQPAAQQPENTKSAFQTPKIPAANGKPATSTTSTHKIGRAHV
jgi:hypothetical protein